MAQIGSFVPAEYARIGIVDRIYTRIRTKDLVSSVRNPQCRGPLTPSTVQMSSAFQTDALQIKRALQGATERSLLVMDEFGKGTRAEEGVAIFAATIKELLRRGESAPRTVAITHFHEVYRLGLLGPEEPIQWCTMDFVRSPEGDQLVFLYKVVAGKAQDSLALDCAKRAGLPKDILARAHQLAELYGAHVTPTCLRYAHVDPGLIQKATELIEATLSGSASQDLKLLASRLLTHTSQPRPVLLQSPP